MATDSEELWREYQTQRLQRGVSLFARIAMVIFSLFWAVDWVIYPEHVWTFLALRATCVLGYALLLNPARWPSDHVALTLLGVLQVWWVTLTICAMLMYTGYGESLYYAGLILAMLAVGLVFPWTWQALLVVGLGVTTMFAVTAAMDPDLALIPAVNNTAFLLGGLGMALAGNIRDTTLARADFDSRQQLAEALEKLTELDRTKSEFFANLSHEFRTPLTLILSPLDVVLQDPGAELTDGLRTTIVRVRRSASRLLGLINSLLDLSKLEAGKMELQVGEIELNAFLSETASAFAPLASRRGIGLHVDVRPEPVVIYADVGKLDMVMHNLLGNAMKFTEEGSVSITLSANEETVDISVQDTGIGISADARDKIFNRFGQADGSVTRRFGGTGIGLALAKELIELHGGSIALESEVGTGSCFTVTLPRRLVVDTALPLAEGPGEVSAPKRPLQPADLSEEGAIEAQAPTLPPDAPRLLVVEDTAKLRAFLVEVLQRDYRVAVAEDGLEGLEVARKTRPDLVLSDVMMPRMSGYELVKALRDDPATEGIPVVLLTAKQGPGSVVEGFAHGADDYLPKPFGIHELMARIRAQLKLRRLSMKLAEARKASMMSTLAAGLAHEVRNPVNAIQNGLAALRMVWDEDDRETAEELLQVIEDSSRRIHLMVEELIGHAHLQKAAERPWIFTEGIDATLRLLEHSRPGARDVRTEYVFSGAVAGRPEQLDQIVLNLLDNALRTGAPVRVRTEEREGGVAISVIDEGPGIDVDVLPHIFDPFFTTRSVGEGTGLGLHLSQTIARAHHGELTVSSTPGQGACFTLWLPLEPPQPIQRHPELESVT